ncbi:MAG: DNA polymerase III subunit gamma/tau [Ignavibacteria bacterium]|jgi:DNA polymerase-3 subunit gamma/tau|nr:DNA polymerase III subunit gamma/tau [Ignavibacteria bacterium]MCU7502375.1 DNA polymerase III subunit gamma/tau [Ignavibacteria bacterium]MCU7515060.1 DNA polymerase III subunit gamma/tau [Ignavibacteria bacterium]
MSYIVTARKWRPNRFEDVVGQEHITTTLKNAIKNNRIAHAYLFAGPRGVGKTTTARILAKTLNCLNPVDFEPCNECEMCQSFNTSQSLDIIEIDGASNRRIEEIRVLRESVKYAPTKGKSKVYIIDEVHMLTNESFNALLKTLEEPPEHTIFIFATTDVHKVPLTIISRCQRFDFRRIELDTIKKLLKNIAENEKIEIDDQSLTIIARKADGALRDAESIFDQIISFSGNKVEAQAVARMLNLIDDEVYFTISDAILEKRFLAAFEVSKTVYENGWNFIDFMNGLVEHFRNIMTVVLTGRTKLIETAEIYKEKYLCYKEKFSEGDLLRIMNYLNKTQQELRITQNHKLLIEVALCHLIGLEKSASIREAIANLQEVKKIAPVTVRRDAAPRPAAAQESVSREPQPSNGGGASERAAVTAKVSEGDQPAFQEILSRWSHFVDEVNQEKFIVGSVLQNMKVLGMEGAKLDVELKDVHDRKMILQLRDYFLSKTEAVFGKGLIFNFTDESATEDVDDFMEVGSNAAPEPQPEEPDADPLVNAIKSELGGDEIQ